MFPSTGALVPSLSGPSSREMVMLLLVKGVIYVFSSLSLMFLVGLVENLQVFSKVAHGLRSRQLG